MSAWVYVCDDLQTARKQFTPHHSYCRTTPTAGPMCRGRAALRPPSTDMSRVGSHLVHRWCHLAKSKPDAHRAVLWERDIFLLLFLFSTKDALRLVAGFGGPTTVDT